MVRTTEKNRDTSPKRSQPSSESLRQQFQHIREMAFSTDEQREMAKQMLEQMGKDILERLDSIVRYNKNHKPHLSKDKPPCDLPASATYEDVANYFDYYETKDLLENKVSRYIELHPTEEDPNFDKQDANKSLKENYYKWLGKYFQTEEIEEQKNWEDFIEYLETKRKRYANKRKNESNEALRYLYDHMDFLVDFEGGYYNPIKYIGVELGYYDYLLHDFDYDYRNIDRSIEEYSNNQVDKQ